MSISQTFHGKCTTGYLNHEIIKLIKSLNIQQALRKFSATMKGLYRQTYQIIDCWTAFISIWGLWLINFDSNIYLSLFKQPCCIWMKNKEGCQPIHFDSVCQTFFSSGCQPLLLILVVNLSLKFDSIFKLQRISYQIPFWPWCREHRYLMNHDVYIADCHLVCGIT